MSGSYCRPGYDDCAYRARLAESLGPGAYQIDTPRPWCTPCFPADVLNGYVSDCATTARVDVESDLFGYTHRLSRCPDLQVPRPMCDAVWNAPEAECTGLTPEEPRLIDPPCTLRGAGINRWEWLCEDPQTVGMALRRPEFVSTRALVKQNFRPCLERPLDQSDTVPPPAPPDDTGYPTPKQWRCAYPTPGGGATGLLWPPTVTEPMTFAEATRCTSRYAY
jgi:hypothetical protein